jgi:dTDP-glucose 4,6-dehydratase
MTNLLVTGGAGFIGANFVHHWLREHPEDRLVVLDALTYSGNLANLELVRNREELRFVHGNIRDTSLVETLLRAEGIGLIVHFAAESHVDRSIAGPDAFIETNVIGTHSLLKAARRVWIDEKLVSSHRFHHVSTDEVYGSLGPSDPAFTENTPYAPNSPYSASKAASDHLVRAYHSTYGLNVTTSNCSNNYGPYQFPEKLIPLLIVNILEGRSLPVYGDGRHVRNWLHVSDHCRGIDCVIARGKSGEVYNIGGCTEYENIAIVQDLCQILDAQFAANSTLRYRFPRSPAGKAIGSSSLITYVADRPGHDRRYAVDSRKIEAELGFTSRVRLAEGLTSTALWILENEDWWRPMLGSL